MSIPVSQPGWWYEYTPVPNGAGSWTYTYTSNVNSGKPSTEDEKPAHATVKDIPGWKRCPPTASGLLDADMQAGWTCLSTGNWRDIVMDSDGFLYFRKGATLTPEKGHLAACWAVQLTSYQTQKGAPIRVAAYIPKEASQEMKVLGVYEGLAAKDQYLPIGKILRQPVL